MASEFGKRLRVSVFGQSHGKAIGVVMDGLPAGEQINPSELMRFLERRRPGGPLSTARREEDAPVFLSGVLEGRTCGSPLCAIIENRDVRSEDYEELADKPRPSHADYTAYIKWGESVDMRGGGHFSGRLTAPLCIAGGIAKQILERRGISVGAHLCEAGGEKDVVFPAPSNEGAVLHNRAKGIPGDRRCGRNAHARGHRCCGAGGGTPWAESWNAPQSGFPLGWEHPCSTAWRADLPRRCSAFRR